MKKGVFLQISAILLKMRLINEKWTLVPWALVKLMFHRAFNSKLLYVYSVKFCSLNNKYFASSYFSFRGNIMILCSYLWEHNYTSQYYCLIVVSNLMLLLLFNPPSQESYSSSTIRIFKWLNFSEILQWQSLFFLISFSKVHLGILVVTVKMLGKVSYHEHHKKF